MSAIGRNFTGLSAVVILVACSLGPANPPTVNVLDVRLDAVSLTQQRLTTLLCVTNPNPAAVTFRRAVISLDVAGSALGTGTTDQPVSIAPASSVIVPLSVETTAANLGAAVWGTVLDGPTYRLHGTIQLQGMLGLTVPFSRSGQLDPVQGTHALVNIALAPSLSPCRTEAGG